jgi:UDPglucose 6-dehydrogenase
VRVFLFGSGVVGEATGKGLNESGHEVIFVDSSESRLCKLNSAGFRAIEPNSMLLKHDDSVIVCVPTPTTSAGMDLTSLSVACKTLGLAISTLSRTEHAFIIFRSTMLPGTTRQVLIPALESSSNKTCGNQFFVTYSPEYLRGHTAEDDFRNTQDLTIGSSAGPDTGSGNLERLYNSFNLRTHQFTYEEAEFQKYVHNCFNAQKIPSLMK